MPFSLLSALAHPQSVWCWVRFLQEYPSVDREQLLGLIPRHIFVSYREVIDTAYEVADSANL